VNVRNHPQALVHLRPTRQDGQPLLRGVQHLLHVRHDTRNVGRNQGVLTSVFMLANHPGIVKKETYVRLQSRGSPLEPPYGSLEGFIDRRRFADESGNLL
jgi:hypothetical protein